MSTDDIKFDLDQALADLRAGKSMTGKDGFLTPLIKQLTEAALKAEQEQHIASESETGVHSYTIAQNLRPTP